MTNDRSQAPTEKRGNHPPPLAEAYLAECRRLLDVILTSLLESLFVRLDDALYDLADKSETNRLYTVYFDAMRIIRKQRQAIQRRFLRHLRKGAEAAAEGLLESDLQPGPAALDGDPAAVHDEELEETLAVDNLVSKAESRYRRELLQMNAHLARLLDRTEVELHSNPFGPFALGHAFRTALRSAKGLDPQIKLVIYKSFDRQVMDRMGDFYERCLDLAAEGRHRGEAPAVRHGTAPPTPPPASPPAPAPDHGLRSLAAPLPPTVTIPYKALQDLIARQSADDAHAGDLIAVSTEQLLGLLSNLGVRTLQEETSPTVPVRQRLLGAIAVPAPQGRALSREDETTLDLVFLFFEHLLEGNDLADAIKVLLGRLQIPVAKLALLDKGFFLMPDHPARRLLNRIGETAIAWGDGDERGTDSLYGMIERVVERLILEFDGDPALFAQMERFFAAFVSHEEAQARATEIESMASARGEATPSGHRIAAATLESIMGAVPQIPPVVETILREGWLPVMVATYQSDGADSASWRATVETAERLLWSVQPKVGAEDRRQLLRRIPEILRALRTRLAGSGCDQRQLSRWLRDLQTIHLGVVQGETAPGAGDRVQPPGASERPERLAVGSWVELIRSDNARIRLKLAWYSSQEASYLFVDRRGQRSARLSVGEIDELRTHGLLRVVASSREPASDRALLSAVDRLTH